MSDYMPHDSEVREAWISTYARDGWLTNKAILQGQREFHAWLADHDADVAAKALEDAADAMDADDSFRDPLRLKSEWVRMRAAAIRTQQEGTDTPT